MAFGNMIIIQQWYGSTSSNLENYNLSFFFYKRIFKRKKRCTINYKIFIDYGIYYIA